MLNVQLPDGSIRSFEQPLSIGEVAASIGPGLAKAALAGKVDGKLVDLSFASSSDSARDRHRKAPRCAGHPAPLHRAPAGAGHPAPVPGAQVTIGPVIDNGFYYDFAFERAFTPEDLAAIEAEMAKIVAEALPVQRSVMARRCGDRLLQGQGRVVQGRDHRRHHPGREGPLAVRRASSPTCAAARTCRTRANCGSFQADEGGRRLLARRLQERACCSASTAPPGPTRSS
jgi:hypothetical protein